MVRPRIEDGLSWYWIRGVWCLQTLVDTMLDLLSRKGH